LQQQNQSSRNHKQQQNNVFEVYIPENQSGQLVLSPSAVCLEWFPIINLRTIDGESLRFLCFNFKAKPQMKYSEVAARFWFVTQLYRFMVAKNTCKTITFCGTRYPSRCRAMAITFNPR